MEKLRITPTIGTDPALTMQVLRLIKKREDKRVKISSFIKKITFQRNAKNQSA